MKMRFYGAFCIFLPVAIAFTGCDGIEFKEPKGMLPQKKGVN